MRKISVAGLVVALAVFAAVASAEQRGMIGVRYDWEGPSGVLTLANAEGMPFDVWNSRGAKVLSGVSPASEASFLVPNVGFSANGVMLYVRVGATVFTVTDKEWIWE